MLILYLWAVLLAGSGLAVSFIKGWGLVSVIMAFSVVVIALTYVPNRVQQRRNGSRRHLRAVPEAEETKTA